jgi:RNA polymerase sporulation-specific sigma factor
VSSRVELAPLTELADDALVARFHSGSDEALQILIERYRRFARAKARGYFLVGGDADDVEQEALIGLYKAARDFRAEHQASFRAFAELCITRQIITAIKTATRQKHQPLNQYVSISGIKTATRQKHQPLNQYVSISGVRGSDDPGEYSVEELLHSHHGADPAERVVADERMTRMRVSMADMLSGLEVDVLRLYVEGKSYQEIGEQLGRHVKSIDNALQRIKRKLDQHLTDRAVEDLEAELAAS